MIHEPHLLENRTHIQGESVWHYTCNAPQLDVLAREGIKTVGEKYGCKDQREVLLIPVSLYERYGLNLNNSSNSAPIETQGLVLQSELLLRILSCQESSSEDEKISF